MGSPALYTQVVSQGPVRAVILAGGSGSRLWPLSREQMPKQLLNLVGEATLLETTLSRLAPLIDRGDVWVVTSEALQAGEGYEALQGLHTILEPVGRNTAPAIAVAAALMLDIQKEDPLMLVLPADHLIRDEQGFHAALRLGLDTAADGWLVTFGIRPTRPDTGFGYIQAEDPSSGIRDQGSGIRDQGTEDSDQLSVNCRLPTADCRLSPSLSPQSSVLKVVRFTEKPDYATAVSMLEAGDYYWNSGMFVWKASAILKELETHVPELWRVLASLRRRWRRGEPWQQVIRDGFAAMPSISIDYGVMEKSTHVRLVPCEIGWSDVGSWDTVYDIMKQDAAGNVVSGDVITLDCRHSLLRSRSRLLAAVGLEDVIAVETDDAVLLVRRGESQRVREVVDALKKRGSREHVAHRTVHRPWGSYTVLEDDGAGCRVRRIEVKPGASLALHRHHSGHWIVISGTATVTHDGETFTLATNESRHIPSGTEHRLENHGGELLRLIEVRAEPPDRGQGTEDSSQ